VVKIRIASSNTADVDNRGWPGCVKVWPEDALEMVANKFLEDVDLESKVRVETVVMCKHFHESVRLMSEQYYAELLRYNYVTPTSYLELILTFKKLLALKRDNIQILRNRYITGLEKLEFAASQVQYDLQVFDVGHGRCEMLFWPPSGLQLPGGWVGG